MHNNSRAHAPPRTSGRGARSTDPCANVARRPGPRSRRKRSSSAARTLGGSDAGSAFSLALPFSPPPSLFAGRGRSGCRSTSCTCVRPNPSRVA
eukprot:31454-Pelagococcus_subviridis.AAC.5